LTLDFEIVMNAVFSRIVDITHIPRTNSATEYTKRIYV